MEFTRSDLICASGIEGELEYIEFYNRRENIDVVKEGITPLINAAKNKCMENVIFIISLGADINIKCSNGLSALDYAIINLDIKMIEHLIKNGICRKNYDNYNFMKEKFPFLEDFMIKDIEMYIDYYNEYFEKII
jgi:hypothetical protein